MTTLRQFQNSFTVNVDYGRGWCGLSLRFPTWHGARRSATRSKPRSRALSTAATSVATGFEDDGTLVKEVRVDKKLSRNYPTGTLGGQKSHSLAADFFSKGVATLADEEQPFMER